ncbi:putative 12.8 kDa protein [Escherichia phage 310Ecol104PP]|nr:putative 12.8 kDa protein [Escherichia phage 310Ecol104PP]
MKSFKDVKVGEIFCLDNSDQLIRISPLKSTSEKMTVNATLANNSNERFCIENDTETYTVEEFWELSVDCDE